MPVEVIAALVGAAGTLAGVLFGHYFTKDHFRKQMTEALRTKYFEKKVAAYEKLWSLMGPTSEHWIENERILVRKENQSYINPVAARSFFDSMTKMLHSELGVYIGRKMRQEIIPQVREFIENAILKGESQPDGMVKISNNLAHRVENGLNWMRRYSHADIGAQDIQIPAEDMDLTSGK